MIDDEPQIIHIHNININTQDDPDVIEAAIVNALTQISITESPKPNVRVRHISSIDVEDEEEVKSSNRVSKFGLSIKHFIQEILESLI